MQRRVDLPPETVFLRSELLQRGYDDRSILAMVRGRRWHRIRRGAYTESALWDSLDAADRHRLTARAVLRISHPSSVLSHISAAIEYGAPVWGIDLGQVHLTRTDRHAGRREAGVVHHCGDLSNDDVVSCNALPVTRPARAAIETCTIAGTEPALVTVNWLLRHTDATPEDLAASAARLAHWPGALSTRVVLRLCDERNSWPGEARLSYALWRQGLGSHFEPQYPVRTGAGKLIAVVDFADPEHGVFLEFDGKIKYDSGWRGDGVPLSEFLLAEKRREEDVILATGWVCLRICWGDLASPATLATRITSIMVATGGRVDHGSPPSTT